MNFLLTTASQLPSNCLRLRISFYLQKIFIAVRDPYVSSIYAVCPLLLTDDVICFLFPARRPYDSFRDEQGLAKKAWKSCSIRFRETLHCAATTSFQLWKFGCLSTHVAVTHDDTRDESEVSVFHSFTVVPKFLSRDSANSSRVQDFIKLPVSTFIARV